MAALPRVTSDTIKVIATLRVIAQLPIRSKKGCVFFIKNQEIVGNLNIQIASIKKSIDAVNKITTF
jgi:hypothetical protein